jgi:hypothetical protein
MNKFIKIMFLLKTCQSLFEYVGNWLYKSDTALEAGFRGYIGLVSSLWIRASAK